MNESQDTTRSNPRIRNWVAIARVCHLVKQKLDRELRPLDIKSPQLDVLVNLLTHEGITQQELADRLLVGRSNMTMLLPQLEKRGILVRRPCADDRRALRVYLTDSGRDLATRALQVQRAVVDDIMALSTPEECDMVGDQMRRIIDRLLNDETRELDTAG